MTPAILDHLWQSTLVALAVAVLILAFRRASAGVRHGLWFAASAKFLIPFAALAALGKTLAPTVSIPVAARPEAMLIARAARPFSRSSLAQFPFAHAPALAAPASAGRPAVSAAVQAAPHAALTIDPLLILAAIWGLGCALVLVHWMVRWAKVSATVRSATLLPWRGPMTVLASSSMMEPGLVGLWRPVLLVPQSLPEHLSPQEIDAILAHEAAHLRRRDNVTAAVHMLVEALFWFHPLVWWIGARMIDEREQACDEAVVRAGHDRSTYARSLVESCRLYLQSPLSCVAGASGADLKTRVESIMTAPLASPLSRSKKALLLAAGACALATPVAAGMLTSPQDRAAVAHAVSEASRAVSTHPFAPFSAATASTDEAAAQAIKLEPSPDVLAPAPAVAGSEVKPVVLAQTLTTPPTIPAAAAETPRQSAAPPAPPADPKAAAERFVESYAALNQSHVAARWLTSLCIRVVGLPSDQAAAVKARIEAVGKAVGIPAPSGERQVVTGSRIGGRLFVDPRGGCLGDNIEIGFTSDPQGMLAGVMKRGTRALGDSTSPTKDVKTVTLPIQAWYLTNGISLAANDASRGTGANSLKVDVVYQFEYGTTFSAPTPQTGGDSGYGSACCGGDYAGSGAAAIDAHRGFHNIFIIVDARKVQGKSLGLISDYVAMLALSQPGNLGQCNVLPSITDLFANCPGRSAPDGLTPADAAFLTALYAKDGAQVRPALEDGIAKRMADILSSAKENARAEAAPSRPIRPASMVTPGKDAARPGLTLTAATGRSSEARQQASAFVQLFAGTLWNDDPICVRVQGAEPDKTDRVKARVEADARAAGLSVSRICTYAQTRVDIRFAEDADRAVHDARAENAQQWPFPLERPEGAARPIRAWYQLQWDTAGAMPWAHGEQGADPERRKKLGLAIVVIDPRRVSDRSLDAVADYAALLALSQPHALDRCNVLPSVTDMFASCPGGAATAGLTEADRAYLKALCAGNPEIRATRFPSDVIDGMAKLLSPARMASR